jgi:flavin-dependent dehydrogenase
VALFAGDAVLTADLPKPPSAGHGWGRALGREHLDTLLLRQAIVAGATVVQPATARRLEPTTHGYRCIIQHADTREESSIEAGLVIGAHGSWDLGQLPTQVNRLSPCPGDLFGFKAHFHNSSLPNDLMPLMSFPGGYGGMVHTDGGRVSLSCCVRRDVLARLRNPGDVAGAAVLDHIRSHSRGVREALSEARLEEAWLAAGPIRPGIRLTSGPGLFTVGNAAGEAHPVVAEGISMAMQAAWLLSERLIAWKQQGGSRTALNTVAADYARAWRKSFAPRIRAASLIAHWAMRPWLVALTRPFVRCWPALLSWGAKVSGKATEVVTQPA